MTPRLQTVLNQLPALKLAELEKVHSATAHLLESSTPPNPGDRAGVFFSALRFLLADAGIKISPRLPQSAVWKSQVAVALAFVEKTTPGLNKVEFLALAHLYAAALIEFTVQTCHLSPRFAVRMVGRLADAVNLAFPGYAEAGLLPKLVHKAGNPPVGALKAKEPALQA